MANEQPAQEALQQINQRQYQVELEQQGITKILKLGLAFYAKTVAIAHEIDQSSPT